MKANRLGRAAASAAVVLSTLAGVVVGTAGTADAIEIRQVEQTYNRYCDKPTTSIETTELWGGRILCGGGFGVEISSVLFRNDGRQAFFVGTDHAVWTRWKEYGVMSDWVSLGGRLSGDVTINAWNSSGFIQLMGKGTDGRYWFDNRDVNGSWTGWFR
ncbi:hypothetical protein ACFVVL_25510 [Kitasatospora sp. NPDC058115]|uniref:hypothetical protein n=1 Tax=Kitasatospora sp. NPDC058115 TaxID=3346347 RepID=UPI0036DF89D9